MKGATDRLVPTGNQKLETREPTPVDVDGASAPLPTLNELIRGRRSIRRFRDRPVDPNLISRLIEVASWAPSPHNSQPWRFVILSEPAKTRLADAMGEALRRDLHAGGLEADSAGAQVQRSRTRIAEAPAAVLCSTVDDGLKLTGGREHDHLERMMAVQSVGAALQTLFLAAWAEGLGTCWMAAPMYCRSEVREALDLPDEHRPQALVLMGHADTAPPARPRRPAGELILRR